MVFIYFCLNNIAIPVYTFLLPIIGLINSGKLPALYTIVIGVVFITVFYRNVFFIGYFLKIAVAVLYDTSSNNDFLCRTRATSMFNKFFNFKHNFGNLPSSPTIFVVNYPTNFFDYFAGILIPKDIAFVMADVWFTRITWGKLMKNVIYRKKKYGNSYDDVKTQMQQMIANGKSVLAYVTTYVTTGSEKHGNKLYTGRVRTGMFRIAQELGVTITPVVMDYIDQGSGVIPAQNFQVHIADSFYVTDPLSDARRTRRLYVKFLRKFTRQKFKLDTIR